MAVERLETWQKWLFGILTALIISGVPVTVGYVVSIHDTLLKIEGKVEFTNYRLGKVEEDKEEFKDEIEKASREIFTLNTRLDNLTTTRIRK